MDFVNKWDERTRNVSVRRGWRFVLRAVLRNVPNDSTKIGTGREVGVSPPPKRNGRVVLVQHRIVRGRTKGVVLRVSGLEWD